MKKVFVTLALSAALAVPTMAQIKFGVMAGINTTKLSTPTSLKAAQLQTKQAAGWFVGPKLYATIPVVGLGVDAAVLYNQRKAMTSLTTTGATITNHTLRSLAMPINLRYSLGLGSLAAVYVATGPQFDFNIGNRSWITELKNTTLFRTQKAELSWNVAAGIRLLSHLEVGASYNFGLGKTAKLVKDLARVEPNATTRTCSFSLQAVYIF